MRFNLRNFNQANLVRLSSEETDTRISSVHSSWFIG